MLKETESILNSLNKFKLIDIQTDFTIVIKIVT